MAAEAATAGFAVAFVLARGLQLLLPTMTKTKTMLLKVLVAMIAALYLGGCGCSVENGAYAEAAPTDESATRKLSVELVTLDYVADANTIATGVRVDDASLSSVQLTLSVTRANGTSAGTPTSWTGTPAEAAAGVEVPIADRIAEGESVTIYASVTAPDGRFGSVSRTVAVRSSN